MGGKGKLKKIAELNALPNVYQNFSFENKILQDHNGKEIDFRNKWRDLQFKNNNPLVLELACGKGDYAIGLAKLLPNKNFIGIDVKGPRIWKGAKYIYENEIKNVAFVRIRIELIEHFFGEGEVDEIWITFPDPFSKEGHNPNRRLTCPDFLNRYRTICKKDAVINLKTDSKFLYDYSKEVVEEQELPVLHAIENIYAQNEYPKELEIKTFYEKMHLEEGRTINYLQFKLNRE